MDILFTQGCQGILYVSEGEDLKAAAVPGKGQMKKEHYKKDIPFSQTDVCEIRYYIDKSTETESPTDKRVFFLYEKKEYYGKAQERRTHPIDISCIIEIHTKREVPVCGSTFNNRV